MITRNRVASFFFPFFLLPLTIFFFLFLFLSFSILPLGSLCGHLGPPLWASRAPPQEPGPLDSVKVVIPQLRPSAYGCIMHHQRCINSLFLLNTISYQKSCTMQFKAQLCKLFKCIFPEIKQWRIMPTLFRGPGSPFCTPVSSRGVGLNMLKNY